MRHLNKNLLILFLGVCFIGLYSCKDENKKDAVDSPTETNQQSPDIHESAHDEAQAEMDQDTIHLTLSGDDAMKFDKKELTVKEGQTVVLTLKHTGKMSKSTMGHNFVLLDKGVTPSTFAQKAMKAKDNDYIPDSDRIIAHTDLIGGGETSEVTFKAPEKGEYDFICTFPGHYVNMHGKFIVK